MIGRVIGTYKIEQKLGEGGMGAVYKGVDTMLDREVAIKALKPELASQTAVVERFRSEAVTLAKLHHPNIATLYSLFRQGDELYMVLEYVRGETLDEIMTRNGALSAEQVIPAFCQILDGINHAHEVGIIHRDIKPANIVMTENGTPKVLDFGIARLLGTNRMTRAGNIIGTLEYMAPEQVKGLETDARTDTYALGMMLYEVLTGRTPFDTENEFELMKLQTESMPPNPRSINPSIPLAVESAIMHAIQKDPDERFQTAGEFREFLVDAGFVPDSPTRRITDPNKSISINQQSLPIPPPETAVQATSSGSIIKETRLGTPAAPSLYEASATEDFAGDQLADPDFYTSDATPSSSFLDNLTWIHYAGAGSVAAILLGILVLIPIVIFSGGVSVGETKQTNSANSKAGNEQKKVEVAKPEPTPTVAQAPAETPVPRAPIAITPIESPTPSEPARTTEPIDRQKPAAPAKKTATAKKPVRGRNLRDARCALTGDC